MIMIYSTYRYGTIIYFLDLCVYFIKNLFVFEEKRLNKKVMTKFSFGTYSNVKLNDDRMVDIFTMRGVKKKSYLK